MNKFFKRIIPATILATCCTVSVFSMTACNEGKDYSDDLAKLQQQIDDQKNQINDLKNENSSLKDQISNITPGDTDYTDEIEKLQQQIEALKGQNANYLQESEKLKQQIETLKTNNESNLSEISKLETQLANLKTSNDSNLSEIENLQQQIAILQQGNSNELKTYKIGETFTFNYRDTYIFSITLETRTKLVIRNIKSPAPLQLNDFIQIQRIGTLEGLPSSGMITLDNTTLKKDAEYLKDLSGLIGEHHTTLYFGIPLSNNSILSYAVFDITTSSIPSSSY